MPRAPGKIRRVIYDLFVSLGWRDRSYSLTDLADLRREIYGSNKPTEDYGPLMWQAPSAYCEQTASPPLSPPNSRLKSPGR
jgi:hypothetical protein